MQFIVSAYEIPLFVYDTVKSRRLPKIGILFFRLSTVEQFVERLVIMLLIIVPIDQNDVCGSRVRARFLNAYSANFVSNKWNHIWYLWVVHGPQANVNGFKLQSAIHSPAPRRKSARRKLNNRVTRQRTRLCQ